MSEAIALFRVGETIAFYFLFLYFHNRLSLAVQPAVCRFGEAFIAPPMDEVRKGDPSVMVLYIRNCIVVFEFTQTKPKTWVILVGSLHSQSCVSSARSFMTATQVCERSRPARGVMQSVETRCHPPQKNISHSVQKQIEKDSTL